MESAIRNQVFKLFIGGLTIETTETEILNHFSKFGFVFDILIIRNRETSISKGYGFISCNNVNTYQRILSTEHVIDGRVIDCHDSFKKNEEPEKFKDNANKKIFVGGLSLETTDQDLTDYFSQFGSIRQAYVIKDPVSRRSKKFGFAIMKTQESVDQVLDTTVHVIRGIPVSCKLFVRLDQQSGSKGYTSTSNRYHKQSALDSRTGHISRSYGVQEGVNNPCEGPERSIYICAQSDRFGDDETGQAHLPSHYVPDPNNETFGHQGVEAREQQTQDSHCLYSHRRRDYGSSRFAFQSQVYSDAYQPAMYDVQPKGNPTQEFGMITDGYVAPMILDGDEFATSNDLGTSNPSNCNINNPPIIQSYYPEKVDDLSTWSVQANGVLPERVQRVDGLGSVAQSNNRDNGEVQQVSECTGSRITAPETNHPVQSSSPGFVKFEPPPIQGFPRNSEKPPNKLHHLCLVPNQGRFSSAAVGGRPGERDQDSNLRYNLCRCQFFYIRLRNRKPKAQ